MFGRLGESGHTTLQRWPAWPYTLQCNRNSFHAHTEVDLILTTVLALEGRVGAEAPEADAAVHVKSANSVGRRLSPIWPW